jgi:beta-phosphoglucomutase
VPCRAVIFDFNGTLSDDEPILYRIYARLFAEHGCPLGEDDYYRHLAGLSDPEIVRRWLGDRDDAEAVVHQRVTRYREAVADGATVHTPVRRAVAFAAARVPVAIVSGAAAAEIRPVVAAAGLAGYLTAVVSADDVVHGKPHPEGYLRALELLSVRAPGLAADEVTAFEDTEAGVASARSAGVGYVLAMKTTLDPHRLAGADRLIDRLDVEVVRSCLS